MRRLAIVGLGAVTSLGIGVSDTWSRLTKGNSGARAIERFDATNLKTRIAATIDHRAVGIDQEGAFFNLRLTIGSGARALGEALAQANLDASPLRCPLYLGYSGTDIDWSVHRLHAQEICRTLPEHESYTLLRTANPRLRVLPRNEQMDVANAICEAHNISGPRMMISTACASGASAVEIAARAIRLGLTDLAIAGGVDCSVMPEIVVRFSLLSVLSTDGERAQAACRPFALDRNGFVIGEAAAFLVLESEESAVRRKVRPLAAYLGAASNSDAFHRTRGDPLAAGQSRCMSMALENAGVAPKEVQYINAHGTGTQENDKSETVAIKRSFGEHAYRLCVSSSKSMVGHTMSAAGALEALITVMSLRSGVIPPTANYNSPDPDLDLDFVPNAARYQDVGVAMSNAFGFGGHNVSLVFGRW